MQRTPPRSKKVFKWTCGQKFKPKLTPKKTHVQVWTYWSTGHTLAEVNMWKYSHSYPVAAVKKLARGEWKTDLVGVPDRQSVYSWINIGRKVQFYCDNLSIDGHAQTAIARAVLRHLKVRY
jgi:hypothetical protein